MCPGQVKLKEVHFHHQLRICLAEEKEEEVEAVEKEQESEEMGEGACTVVIVDPEGDLCSECPPGLILIFFSQ